MRSSGGRGADAWMIAIPLLAVLVVGAMAGGGPDAALLTLERTVRQVITAGWEFARSLF